MRNINICIFFTVSNNWCENVHKLVTPCPRIGTKFCLGLVAISSLLFEEMSGKYSHLLTINGAHMHAKGGNF